MEAVPDATDMNSRPGLWMPPRLHVTQTRSICNPRGVCVWPFSVSAPGLWSPRLPFGECHHH
eukprot:4377387-Pyramimonas_sp.AAC.1